MLLESSACGFDFCTVRIAYGLTHMKFLCMSTKRKRSWINVNTHPYFKPIILIQLYIFGTILFFNIMSTSSNHIMWNNSLVKRLLESIITNGDHLNGRGIDILHNNATFVMFLHVCSTLSLVRILVLPFSQCVNSSDWHKVKNARRRNADKRFFVPPGKGVFFIFESGPFF